MLFSLYTVMLTVYTKDARTLCQAMEGLMVGRTVIGRKFSLASFSPFLNTGVHSPILDRLDNTTRFLSF